ncbi:MULTISPECIES: peptide IlvX [Enterobacteriaceae]
MSSSTKFCFSRYPAGN